MGRWKDTEVRFLREACELVPARAAFFAALALAFCADATEQDGQILAATRDKRPSAPLGAVVLALVVFAVAILSKRRRPVSRVLGKCAGVESGDCCYEYPG